MLLAAFAIAAAAAALSAQEHGLLDQAYTGTIVSTYPDGRLGKLHLHADGNYDAIGRRGDASSGSWSLAHGRMCMKQRAPVWYPIAFCTAVPSGATWQAKAPSGETVHVHLQPGR